MLPAGPVLRALTWLTLVNTLGNGLFFTTSALFFTRSVGLTPAQLGLGLATAGACGVAAGPPLGWLADRWGPLRVLLVAFAGEGIGMMGYGLIHSFAAFLPIACGIAFLDRGAAAVRNALIATALPAADRVQGRAYLRAVTNVGIGAGAALAALALASNTRGAYLAIVTANALTFLACAALLVLMRARISPVGAPAGARAGAGPAEGGAGAAANEPRAGRRSALTDRPYLVITALNGVMTLQYGLLDVGIPLWAVRSTHAPRLIVSAVLVLNTVLVVLLQVRASRGTQDPRRAARRCLWSGLLLAAACVSYGYAHGLPAVAAVALLLAGAVIQTLGEMTSAAAGWALSYELADQTAHGVYQGVFNSGFSAGILLSPLAVTSTAIRFGVVGWLALGAVFALAGAAFVPAVRWALARRRAAGSAVPRPVAADL